MINQRSAASPDEAAAITAEQRNAALSFRLAEYQTVESRLQFLREDLVRIDTLAPLAVAAIYSWAFSRDDLRAIGGNVLFVVPLLVSIIAFLRHQARYNAVYRIEARLRAIEESFLIPIGGTGYETWLVTEKPNRRWYHPPLMASRALLWIVMLIGTGSIAAYMMNSKHPPPKVATRIVIERVNP